MATKIINVATEFSRAPGGRYYTDGEASGQEFRERLLIPAYNEFDEIIIEMDGTRGYPSSFLDEAFGGLVRVMQISPSDFAKKIKFKASPDFEIYVQDVFSYVDQTAHA
jgi:hypothetical protein